MKEKITFELFLTPDKSIQEQSKQEILKKFGARLEPLVDAEKQPDDYKLGNFFEITLKVEKDKIWEGVRKLIEIDGVLDVDPVVPAKFDKDLAYLESQGEKEEKKKQDKRQRPDAGWFHNPIRFREAIEYAKTEHEAGRGCYAGGETMVKIGQLDTGYSDHPEVVKIKKNKGWNYVAPPFWIRLFKRSWRQDPKDRLIKIPVIKWASHGTSSASVMIGIDTDRLKIAKGYMDRTNGVFPYVDLIPYRISDSIISFHNNMARAAAQAIVDGCKIITASHAQLIKSRMLEQVAEEAYENGIIWVAAAGTHIARVKKIWIFPARFPEVLAIAASTQEGEPWELTHGGVAVEICAPGYDIYRPMARRSFFGLFGKPKYEYSWSEGSTFSAPITAAAAALWLAHHGEKKLNQLYKEPWQRVEAFRKVLRESATPHRKDEYNKYYGTGILNVEQLLKTALPKAEQLKHVDEKPARPDESKATARTINYVTDKELTYWTCHAKVKTEDQKDDELYNYVYEKSSNKAREVLKNVTGKIEEFADESKPGFQNNPNSEALKSYIKEFARVQEK
ncbi:MAG: S8/S53 family peptidase [bacterium]|nr:MAG: S8/S53 family peptidase [bacterium]